MIRRLFKNPINFIPKQTYLMVYLSVVISLMTLSCLSPNQKLARKAGGKNGIFAKITTEKGVIIAKLEYQKVPLLVANFIGLAEGTIPNTSKIAGKPFYDSLKFYKVYKNYMAISGCPKNSGTGNPGYVFMDEFHPNLKHDTPGVLSYLTDVPHNNGSQFVITMRESSVLDQRNSIFGKVISGMEVVNSIQQGDYMIKVEIIRIGRKAHQFDPQAVFKKNGFDNMIQR